MLKLIRHQGRETRFEYDALGRRTAKIHRNKITRWLWDGNVPLHEWEYEEADRPHQFVNELDELVWSHEESCNKEELITWIFDEGTFKPSAKLIGEKRYSIITDYLGTPVQMYDEQGELTWDADYDIYGKIRKLHVGSLSDCPFRYQGQYEDVETGLYYNRFRYYSPDSGMYVNQDPVRLAGGMPNFYSYVSDLNFQFDPLGLSSHLSSLVSFTDSAGTKLSANGYTDVSHLSDTQLKQIHYMNTGGRNGMAILDKQGNSIVAHHYKQNANGPIVLLPSKHHDKPHTNPGQHPFGKRKGSGLTIDERKSFNNWRKEFYADLAEKELDKRGIKVKCYG